MAQALIAGALFMGLVLLFGSLASAQHVQPPVDLPPAPFDIETAIGVATGAGGTGVATFVFADGIEPWSALIVRAGTSDGVDRVTLTLSMETRTLTIEAEDSVPTNVATILVNKDFVRTYVETAEDSLAIQVSQAVNYQGLTVSDDAGGAEVYVFNVTHFSTQTIKISPSALNGDVFLGADGLTIMGWAVIGAAVVVTAVAAGIALRKRP